MTSPDLPSPSTSTPSVVEAHWCAVLGVDDCHPSDRFFDMGGDSLLAIDLLQRIENDVAAEVPVEVLFLDGTLAALVSAVTDLART